MRLLLLLGGLLIVAFVPLFFAVATYTSLTLQKLREAQARSLGRAVAGQVAEAGLHRPDDELMPLLRAQVGSEGLEAIGVYRGDGRPVARVGDPGAVSALPPLAKPDREGTADVTTAHGRALAVLVPHGRGAVVAIVRTDDDSAHTTPLLRLLALYTGLVALALLTATYFALTRLIVRPLDSLGHAAQRVASGARQLVVPKTAVRELTALGESFSTMTARLIAEEDKLRAKVTEVEHATERLRQTQAQLVRSERLASVGRLAAGLAHEIGNPIAALMGLEDLLLAGGLEPEEQQDFLQRMRRETERVHRILRDLLAFARPSSVEKGAPPQPGDIEGAVHDTAALVMPHPALRDVDLALDLHRELPLVALGREQLVQVLLNLVLNAADAAGPGGHIRIEAEASTGGARLVVSDDGPGVAPEVRERLFEPFVTTKEVGKGTGLGLAVCRGLVEAVGGTIELDATVGRGARFLIELPRA
ncbi:MAG TPA: ATP-binding protein [Polyangiaceae bacterium]|nr:ATP-binding protein [Polyangiaceae bacterium]